ncbi:phosphonate C-P lyase system protein PhnG [Mesorhizobium onobrychidis]|uniref:Phosphonate C-P lyase system protein PhnG n=1 Tax=Mesorhizobium onobrychidis TaxID=2775404 RepID=A0ABY5QWZ3_9HYPH|nr:phosphonate C-P lyase system protein PhnG [Mesorhizobium onobrychidis]UVC15189.1 phosphonate C-P lyase system protein PhnG [Mesorhizobium onobrychidis]
MGILACASREALEEAAENIGNRPPIEWLRRPHIGLVLVRGRLGGTGNPFNLGEMTVTRCALRLACGTVGLAYVQGRDRRHAELAAIMDALLQKPEKYDAVMLSVIQPLLAKQIERRTLASRKAASTRVDFFTMVRGENPA